MKAAYRVGTLPSSRLQNKYKNTKIKCKGYQNKTHMNNFSLHKKAKRSNLGQCLFKRISRSFTTTLWPRDMTYTAYCQNP